MRMCCEGRLDDFRRTSECTPTPRSRGIRNRPAECTPVTPSGRAGRSARRSTVPSGRRSRQARRRPRRRHDRRNRAKGRPWRPSSTLRWRGMEWGGGQWGRTNPGRPPRTFPGLSRTGMSHFGHAVWIGVPPGRGTPDSGRNADRRHDRRRGREPGAGQPGAGQPGHESGAGRPCARPLLSPRGSLPDLVPHPDGLARPHRPRRPACREARRPGKDAAAVVTVGARRRRLNFTFSLPR